MDFVKHAFPAIADANANTLILGSMPSEVSLQRQQYYGHPRNAFWRIMQALYGIPSELPYAQRTRLLKQQRLALWDVMKACRRQGSLDSNIADDSIVINDFALFLSQHRHIERLFFNGARAEKEYLRQVLPTLPVELARIPRVRLPSTSPAMAMLSFEQKVQQWSRIKLGGEGRTPD